MISTMQMDEISTYILFYFFLIILVVPEKNFRLHNITVYYILYQCFLTFLLPPLTNELLVGRVILHEEKKK